MGIIPKDNPNKFNLDHWETDTSDRNVDYGLVFPIYQRSSQKYQINSVKQYTISSENNTFLNF